MTIFKSTFNYCFPVIFLSFFCFSNPLQGQSCIEIPGGLSTQTTDLGNGNCDYRIDLCIDVPNSPRPKRIQYVLNYDSNGDGSEDASITHNYAPGGSIAPGVYCLSAFAPSQEFIVNNVTCGSSFSVSIVGYTNNSGGTGGDCTTIDGYVGESGFLTALPIELISFEATQKGEMNEIQWSTQSEINNDVQILERSSNPEHGYEEVGRMYSQGDTYETRSYTLEDKNPMPLTYYRLASYDLDESVEYSSIVVVERKTSKMEIQNVFPSPVQEQLTLLYSVEEKGFITLNLFNSIGQVILRQGVDALKGRNSISISTEDLPQGMYVLSLDNGVDMIEQKIIK